MLIYSQAIPAQYSVLRSLIGAYTPNYQGVFLRGYGSQWVGNYWGTSWYSSGDFGAIQYDAIRNIWGEFRPHGYYALFGCTGCFQGWRDGSPEDGGSYNGGRIRFDASYLVPTDYENRPVNKAVHYYIKAAH